MRDIIKQVYEVFGDNLPDKSDYSAHTNKPFPALTITKEYKTWAKFKIAYAAHSITLRNKAAAKVVEKAPKKSEKKKYVNKKDV